MYMGMHSPLRQVYANEAEGEGEGEGDGEGENVSEPRPHQSYAANPIVRFLTSNREWQLLFGDWKVDPPVADTMLSLELSDESMRRRHPIV